VTFLDTTGTGTGGGGAGQAGVTSSGNGGAVASATVANASSGNVATTGAGGQACQGSRDPACDEASYCQPATDSCKGDGSCLPRPEACTEDCPGVCACDGKEYCNACRANEEGVAVAPDAECAPEPADGYAAYYLPGGLDHIIITKKDSGQNACLRMQLDSPSVVGQYMIPSPQSWAVSLISVTNNAADCDDINKQPSGQQGWATSAQGNVKWHVPNGKKLPCDLSVEVLVSFAAPPPGVANNQAMKAAMVPVQGGCI
jgi:hypothetical protein